jgi:hypothetical protein
MTHQQAFLLLSGSDTAPDTRQPQTLPAATGGRWNLIQTPARHLVRSPLLYISAVLAARFFEFYL